MGQLIVNGRYEALSELGRGGMGVVFRAKQRSLDRIVAIKMLSRDLANDGEFRHRFQQEAQIIARIQHDNIVRVYDIEQDRGTFFIIMEYIEGVSLQELLRREGRLDYVRASGLIAQVARALAFAHTQSIVHRDIKPDNIMVVRGEKAMVMDFGIARAEDSSLKTQTGISMGTPKYMSPEQARGLRVDHRSDLYSLGVVMFACVTGELPFTGDSPFTVALKHMQEPPPLPTDKVPGLPLTIEKVILRAMAKDPADRFQSGEEFAAALEAAIWTPGASPAPGAQETEGFEPTVRGAAPKTPAPAEASEIPAAPVESPKETQEWREEAKPGKRKGALALVGAVATVAAVGAAIFLATSRDPGLDDPLGVGVEIASQPAPPPGLAPAPLEEVAPAVAPTPEPAPAEPSAPAPASDPGIALVTATPPPTPARTPAPPREELPGWPDGIYPEIQILDRAIAEFESAKEGSGNDPLGDGVVKAIAREIDKAWTLLEDGEIPEASAPLFHAYVNRTRARIRHASSGDAERVFEEFFRLRPSARERIEALSGR